MEFTNEQVKVFILTVIIGTILYMLVYYRKGRNKSFAGYFQAVVHCFSLVIVSI